MILIAFRHGLRASELVSLRSRTPAGRSTSPRDCRSLGATPQRSTIAGRRTSSCRSTRTQAYEFGSPQPVPEGDQDHGLVAVTVAVAGAGRLTQPLDLTLAAKRH